MKRKFDQNEIQKKRKKKKSSRNEKEESLAREFKLHARFSSDSEGMLVKKDQLQRHAWKGDISAFYNGRKTTYRTCNVKAIWPVISVILLAEVEPFSTPYIEVNLVSRET